MIFQFFFFFKPTRKINWNIEPGQIDRPQWRGLYEQIAFIFKKYLAVYGLSYYYFQFVNEAVDNRFRKGKKIEKKILLINNTIMHGFILFKVVP